MRRLISRRVFVNLGIGSTVAMLCPAVKAAGSARLRARPAAPKQRGVPGRHSLGLGTGRDGYLSIPSAASSGKTLPFILMLHGARGIEGLETYCEGAAKKGIAVAVPESRGRTWDRIKGSFGPDVEFLDRVLAYSFDRVTIDAQRVGIAGFSDGGSYSLSLGLSNGDLFTHVIAYSPEFVSAPIRYGKPPVFIAHGVQDQVLSVNFSEQMAQRLKGSGYAVTLKEFTGGHMMRPDIVTESLDWFVGGRH